MIFSLYDALVPSWLQILGALSGLMAKAEAHCLEQRRAPATLIDARLAPDMYPLGYQVKSAVVHSLGAVEALRQGAFAPDRSSWPDSFAGLRDHLLSAGSRLASVDPAEINGFLGRSVRIEAGTYKAEFVAEEFLMSFSQPNFFFHTSTAYGILREQGLPIGKIDFLGQLRQKT